MKSEHFWYGCFMIAVEKHEVSPSASYGHQRNQGSKSPENNVEEDNWLDSPCVITKENGKKGPT
jgi:hypothetical protein